MFNIEFSMKKSLVAHWTVQSVVLVETVEFTKHNAPVH